MPKITPAISLVLMLSMIIGYTLSPKCEATVPEQPRLRIILDTDANNELNDQHAIACMLLNDHIYDIEGITVNATYNGGSIEEQHTEAERIVNLVIITHG